MQEVVYSQKKIKNKNRRALVLLLLVVLRSREVIPNIYTASWASFVNLDILDSSSVNQLACRKLDTAQPYTWSLKSISHKTTVYTTLPNSVQLQVLVTYLVQDREWNVRGSWILLFMNSW